jgi:hypothetical protein
MFDLQRNIRASQVVPLNIGLYNNSLSGVMDIAAV